MRWASRRPSPTFGFRPQQTIWTRVFTSLSVDSTCFSPAVLPLSVVFQSIQQIRFASKPFEKATRLFSWHMLHPVILGALPDHGPRSPGPAWRDAVRARERLCALRPSRPQADALLRIPLLGPPTPLAQPHVPGQWVLEAWVRYVPVKGYGLDTPLKGYVLPAVIGRNTEA